MTLRVGDNQPLLSHVQVGAPRVTRRAWPEVRSRGQRISIGGKRLGPVNPGRPHIASATDLELEPAVTCVQHPSINLDLPRDDKLALSVSLTTELGLRSQP